MRGVRALLPTGLEEPQRATPLQQLLKKHLCGVARQQAVPELAQDRKVETRIRQVETQQILPVNACADRLRRLAIGEVLPKLHDRHQREPPRGQARLPPRGKQGDKVLILKDGPEGITE